VRFTTGEIRSKNDVKSLVTVSVGLEEVPQERHCSSGQARLLRKFTARQVQRVCVRSVLPRALGELPIAGLHRIPVLLNEVEAPVFMRNDQREVRFVHHAVQALCAVVAHRLVLANGHPAVLVDHGRAGRCELMLG